MSLFSGLVPGRIVHYVLIDRYGNERHRPAMVVQVWNKETGGVNLQVITDGSNDGEIYAKGLFWATSVSYSADPRPSTWHWIEREDDEAVLVAA